VTQLKYYDWDYVNGVCIQYRRTGECRKCGKCCLSSVHYGAVKPYRAGNMRNGGPATDGGGLWHEIHIGRRGYFFKLGSVAALANNEPKCGGFDELSGLCLEHEHPGRGRICTLWPFSPKCLEHFPGCGYSFEEIDRWNMDDLE